MSRFDIYQDENGILHLVIKENSSITVETASVDDLREWLKYEGDE